MESRDENETVIEKPKPLTEEEKQKLAERVGNTTKLEKIYMELHEYKEKALEFALNLYHCVLIMLCFMAVVCYESFKGDKYIEAILSFLGTVVLAKLAKSMPRRNEETVEKIKETIAWKRK